MGTVRATFWGGVELGAAKDPKGVVKLTGTSAANALSGVVPAGARVASFFAVEDHYIAYADNATPDATGAKVFFVPAGTERDVRLEVVSQATFKFAAITAP